MLAILKLDPMPRQVGSIPVIRRAVPQDAAGIVAVLEVIAAERSHSAIDHVWTIEDERRYLEALSPREAVQVAVDRAHGIVGLQILEAERRLEILRRPLIRRQEDGVEVTRVEMPDPEKKNQWW